MRNAEQLEVVCDACQMVPISHLSLDLPQPITGWDRALAERGVEIVLDDLGRPSVPRHVLGELLSERREREARLAAERAERAAAPRAPVPAGIPAVEDSSAFESLVAADPGYTTVREEFGKPSPNFLDEELAEGQRQRRAELAERKALRKAKQTLDEGETKR